MRLVTFQSGGAERLGVAHGDGVLDVAAAAGHAPWASSMLALLDAGRDVLAAVRELDGRWRAGDSAVGSHALRLAEVRLLAPIPRPRKNVFCVGLNYASHVEQNAAALGEEPVIPETPLFFSKPVTAVVGPSDPIVWDPRLTQTLDYEVELALVIGVGGTWIAQEAAYDHIVGYTVANDVSARDLQWRTSQFFYGKGQDTYCPLGPAIVTIDEMPALEDVMVETLVNGEVRQQESAGHMIFDPARVVAELSKGITLEAGDIITLGTPGGCGYQTRPTGYLHDGDVVECQATQVGSIVNPVRLHPDSAR